MSRPISYTSAVTINAVSFADATNIAAENTTYPWSRGYNNSAYTANYARFQLNAASTNTDCYIYYTFDVGDIPSNATITSVVASVRVSRNNRVGTSTVQLYAGTTAKGSSVTFSSTQTTGTNVTPSDITNGGSWARSELNNLRVMITGRRTNTNQTGYIYLFGMSVTVNYSVNGTEYSVTISNSTTGRTEPTGTTYVYQGLEQIVHIYDIADLSNVNVTDDGNDIKSSLVFTPSGTTASTLNPTNLDDYHGYQAPTNPENGYAGTDSSNYAQLNIRGGGAYMLYTFAVPDIPNDAIINSITCQAKVYISSTSTSITNKTIQLYAGTTAKGTATTISTTSGNTVTLTPGTWTAAELKNIKIRMSAEYTGTSNRYIRFYGANLNISYTIRESVYTYTISNISADHTIVISNVQSNKMYTKVNGNWVGLQKVYKKVSNSWVEQTDLTNVFETDKIYVRN